MKRMIRWENKNFDNMGTLKFIACYQCWKLALAHSPMEVLKASGKYKLSITRPVDEYDFHFWDITI